MSIPGIQGGHRDRGGRIPTLRFQHEPALNSGFGTGQSPFIATHEVIISMSQGQYLPAFRNGCRTTIGFLQQGFPVSELYEGLGEAFP